MFRTLTKVSTHNPSSVSHQGFWGVLTVFCLGCQACSTHPSSEHQRQTDLKTVTDSEHLLQLVPLTGSEFIFETCPADASRDKTKKRAKECVIAFVSPQGKPVVFQATDIQNHRDDALGSLEKLVLSDLGVAGGAFMRVAYYLTPGLAADADFLDEITSAGVHTVKDALAIIDAKESALTDLGIHYDLSKNGKITFKKPPKLQAFFDTQWSDYAFKQGFVDFFKEQAWRQLAAHHVTAEEVLSTPSLYKMDSRLQPSIDFDQLVSNYRLTLHKTFTVSDDYASIISDLIHPSLLDDLTRYASLRKMVDSAHVRGGPQEKSNLLAEIFAQKWSHPTPHQLVTEEALSPLIKNYRGPSFDALVLISDFAHWRLPSHGLKKQILQNIALPKQRLRKLSSTYQLRLAQSLLLAKRSPKFLIITALALGSVGVVKLGIKHSKGQQGSSPENSLALRFPSLFETSLTSTSVTSSATDFFTDSTEGITKQLGELLASSGADIAFYCLPSGCRALD